jgi:hypothetical protein
VTIPLNTARRFLEREGYQISTEASAFLSLLLEEEARRISDKAIAVLDQENRDRAVQGLPPRHRLASKDVRRALEEV